VSTQALVLAALVGAAACVERKILAQLMISRPIVVAPLVGWTMGQAQLGLAAGIPLELFFLGAAAYGAAAPDHETLPALAAAAFLASAADTAPVNPALLALAVFGALPLAPLGRRLESALEWLNVRLYERAEAALAAGEPRRATRQGLVGILSVAATGAVTVGIGATAGTVFARPLHEAAQRMGAVPTAAFALFTGLAAALGVKAVRVPGGGFLSAAAAVTVLLVFAATYTVF